MLARSARQPYHPDLRKRQREVTFSPQEIASKRQEDNRPKTAMRKEWVRPVAVFMKPAEGVSCASILKDLKKQVNSDELGVAVQDIKETDSKDLKL